VGLDLPDERHDVPHGVLSAVILQEKLSALGLNKPVARQIAAVVGGHHGQWISVADIRHAKAAIGAQKWRDLQAEIFGALQQLLVCPALTLPDDSNRLNTLSVFLSGFISVCDWIGSVDTYFPYEMGAIEPHSYFERAIGQAEIALTVLGWFGWQPPRDRPQFETLFSFLPNAWQQAAISAFESDGEVPRLILVEYLTGGGKTELALYLADYLVNWLRQGGVYIAMPTQATSNQMFERVSDYLQARYPQQPINVQLIHAQADQHPLYRQLQASP